MSNCSQEIQDKTYIDRALVEDNLIKCYNYQISEESKVLFWQIQF